MEGLTELIHEELTRKGADLVDFGDLTVLPGEVRCGLPVGVAVAIKFPKEVIRGIAHLPTLEYFNWYNALNERLDGLVTFGAERLRSLGYKAVAKTRAQVGNWEEQYKTLLPHKTVATRAGLGWIGKCALLVTEGYGSMIRLSSILTDAPLETTAPVDISKCGECMACADACPAGAISGKPWNTALYRDEFVDILKCDKAAQERSERGFGKAMTLCGKCIEVCPYTRRYLES